MEFKDKVGIEIRAGDLISNSNDPDKVYEIKELRGRLYLGDYKTPLDGLKTNEFWEITVPYEERKKPPPMKPKATEAKTSERRSEHTGGIRNRTIVKLWLVGVGLSSCGGFIAGYNGRTDGVSMLLQVGGILLAAMFAIWAMVRLWKTPDAN